nr:hypothetical protein [Lachnospiraceae bacterium]
NGMEFVFHMITGTAYKEYTISDKNNEYLFCFNKRETGYSEDIEIKLFQDKEKISINDKGKEIILYDIIEDKSAIYTLSINQGEKEIFADILISKQGIKPFFTAFANDKECIRIGQDMTCDICYTYTGLDVVERKITIEKDGAYIKCDSYEGVYVGDKKINEKTKLECGSVIGIYFLKIIYLGNIISVNDIKVNTLNYKDSSVKVNLNRFDKAAADKYRISEKNISDKNKNIVVDRGPAVVIPGSLKTDEMINMIKDLMKTAFIECLPLITMFGGFFFIGLIILLVAELYIFMPFLLLTYAVLGFAITFARAAVQYVIINNPFRKSKGSKDSTLYMQYPSLSYMFKRDREYLWTRYYKHNDFLCYRIGDNFSKPVCIDYSLYRYIGIAGKYGIHEALEVLYNIIGQIALCNCYMDLRMVFLYDENQYNWRAFRRLPHVWDNERKKRYIAENKEKSIKMLEMVMEEIKNNQEGGAYYCIFATDKSLISYNRFLEFNAVCGEKRITTFLLGEDYKDLPHYCDKIFFKGKTEDKIFSLDNKQIITLRLDRINSNKLLKIVEALEKVRIKQSLKLIDTKQISFLKAHNIADIDKFDFQGNYDKNDIAKGISAIVGSNNMGEIIKLDISQNKDGIHGLVVGMTGSGKSEFLVTMILSLALNYTPEELEFLIIDYKGGELVRHFEKLPHLCGSLNNLETPKTDRVLASIKSEVIKRERMLALENVYNIDEFNEKNKVIMPHLVIVIDEFNELVKDRSDYMEEIISLAQIGRSLGIHLILSSQKSLGNVDNNIICNTNYRCCFKMQDKEEIEYIIGTNKVNGKISTGQCYYVSGDNGKADILNVAYSKEAYRKSKEENVSCIELDGTIVENSKQEENLNEFQAVINNIISFWNKKNIQAEKMWLPELDNEIFYDESKDTGEDTEDIIIPTGISDDIFNRKQEIQYIDFTKDKSLLICGDANTDKSFVINTVTYNILQKYKDNVIVAIAEFGNGILKKYKDCNEVKYYLSESNLDEMDNMAECIEEILVNRKLNEDDSKEENGKPYILIIHNYELFKEITRDRYSNLIARILREGMCASMYMIIVADNVGNDGLQNRLHNCIGKIICTYYEDKYNYSKVMKGGSIDCYPEKIKGRGLIKSDDKAVLLQVFSVREEEAKNDILADIQQIS